MKPTDFVPKLAIQPAIFDADLVSFQVAYFLFLFLFSFSWQILLIITWLRANFMIYRRKREERKTNNKLSFRTRCFYDFCFMNSVNSLRQSHGQVCVCHACICIWVIFYCCNSCLAGNFDVHENNKCVPNLSMDEKKRIFTTFIK